VKTVIGYRGILTNVDDFIKRLNDRGEITTQDELENVSIALFEVETIDYRSKVIHDALQGIGKGEVVLIDKSKLTGVKLKKKPTSKFPNHAEMSGISAQVAFAAFKSSGVHFDYPGP
jgi:hypothetical protein